MKNISRREAIETMMAGSAGLAGASLMAEAQTLRYVLPSRLNGWQNHTRSVAVGR